IATDERYGEAGRSPRFDAILFRVVLGFGSLAAAVPWPIWRVLTLLAAFVAMATSAHRRRVAWDNIRHVRGALPPAPLAWLLGAQQIAAHFRTVLATLRIGAMEPEQAGDFRIEGMERATPAFGQRGIVVVAPHAGPYPVLGLLARTWLRDTGFQGEFAVVARLFRPFRSGALMDWFIDRFGRHGVTIIPVHENPTVLANKLKTILDAKGIVVLLVDEPTPTPSLEVPFFDSAIRLPIGPARLARATGSVILPVMAAWGRGRELRIVIDDPIEPSRSPAETLGQIGQAIERFVAGNFNQWSMLTPVWVDPATEPEPAPALPVPPGHAAADLHLHTPGSDGLCTIDEWLGAADRVGVRVIAITDHDHIAAVAAWRAAAGDEAARVIPGAELTARGRIVHLGVLFPEAIPSRLPSPGTPLPDLVRWARGIPG
ncbi:MAG TPA: PHP domain-containing protein, partial [Thermomicrobiales bacterium]|nr:PHP domain-containing protein [Thermomicrobiales bacterium]